MGMLNNDKLSKFTVYQAPPDSSRSPIGVQNGHQCHQRKFRDDIPDGESTAPGIFLA